MNKIILSLTLLLFMNTSDSIIFDFTRDANLSSWYVVDDGVMGGRSKGKLSINDNGNAIFSGEVSLDNYCLLYTSPSPRDHPRSRMPSSA